MSLLIHPKPKKDYWVLFGFRSPPVGKVVEVKLPDNYTLPKGYYLGYSLEGDPLWMSYNAGLKNLEVAIQDIWRNY